MSWSAIHCMDTRHMESVRCAESVAHYLFIQFIMKNQAANFAFVSRSRFRLGMLEACFKHLLKMFRYCEFIHHFGAGNFVMWLGIFIVKIRIYYVCIWEKVALFAHYLNQPIWRRRKSVIRQIKFQRSWWELVFKGFQSCRQQWFMYHIKFQIS